MGAYRNAAKWRNLQRNEPANGVVLATFLFFAGFISFGVTWLFIPVALFLDESINPVNPKR
jgi:hypothetical protein